MNAFITVHGTKLKIEGSLLRTARLDGEKYRFLADPAPLVQNLRHDSERVDLFTFMQPAYETTPRFDYPMEWDNFAALKITTFEDWWTKQIGFKARNKAKQAEKHGVVIREMDLNEELIHGIREIYNETPIRQGKHFPHYGMSLDAVRSYASTFLDCSVFIGAWFEDRLVGFVKLTWDETRTQAGLMHIISMVSHRDKAPTNGLLAHAVRACASRNISYLVYSNFAYGRKQADSLSDFKERNGFQRVDVPRYYVPITPLGHVAFRLGVHHRLIDRIPEAWIAKLRDVRSAWYSRKLQAPEKAL